jgi:hypothetical protein
MKLFSLPACYNDNNNLSGFCSVAEALGPWGLRPDFTDSQTDSDCHGESESVRLTQTMAHRWSHHDVTHHTDTQ